jgi:hypothetical protein
MWQTVLVVPLGDNLMQHSPLIHRAQHSPPSVDPAAVAHTTRPFQITTHKNYSRTRNTKFAICTILMVFHFSANETCRFSNQHIRHAFFFPNCYVYTGNNFFFLEGTYLDILLKDHNTQHVHPDTGQLSPNYKDRNQEQEQNKVL